MYLKWQALVRSVPGGNKLIHGGKIVSVHIVHFVDYHPVKDGYRNGSDAHS